VERIPSGHGRHFKIFSASLLHFTPNFANLPIFEMAPWFTEGFDTRDLQEAKALLEELNQNL